MLMLRIACLIVAVATANAGAQVAQQAVQTMYGNDLQRVAATSDSADDIELAGVLLQNAQHEDTGPALRYALAEQAFRLTQNFTNGYTVAVSALDLMAKTQPDQAEAISVQRLDLELRHYRYARGKQRADSAAIIVDLLEKNAKARAGANDFVAAVRAVQQAQGYAGMLSAEQRSDLDRLLETYSIQLRTTQQLDQYRQRLTANPTDTQTASQIVRLYVVELDDPTSALKYVAATGDATLEQMVKAAAQPLDKLPADQSLALGNWYQDLARTAGKTSKLTMLIHARDAYKAATTAPQVTDAVRMSAKLAGFQVEKLIESESPDGGAAAGKNGKYRIVIWNQHVGHFNDRGAKMINVIWYSGDKEVDSKKDIEMPWARDKDEKIVINYHGPAFDRVRVEITKWQGIGGGLAEIQVYRGEELLSQGKPTRASGSFKSDYAADRVVDGITSSSGNSGYWLLPANSPGWVEVYLNGTPQ